MKQKSRCCYLQILTLGCIISSDASRPASGLDVMLILESATPPFITRPFVIGLPVKRKEELFSFDYYKNCTLLLSSLNHVPSLWDS